jgi:hypothetical protein
VNPYLYPAPLERSLHMLSQWSRLYAGLARNPTFVHQVVDSPLHGCWLVFLRSIADPRIYRPFDLAISPWILPVITAVGLALSFLFFRQRSWLKTGGSSPRCLATLLFSALVVSAQFYFGVGGWAGLFTLGAAQILIPSGASRQDPLLNPRVFLGTALALTWIMTGAWMTLDWDRYYLRSLMFSAVIFAAGLVWFANLVGPRERTRRPSTATGPSTQS